MSSPPDDEPKNERISIEPDAPVEETIQAARSTLREPPAFPDLPEDAPPDVILRAVASLALQLNERERRLLAALEHVGNGMTAMNNRVEAAFARVEQRFASMAGRVQRIDDCVNAINLRAGGSKP